MSETTDDFGTGFGGSITYVDETGLSEGIVSEAIRRVDVASTIERWAQGLQRGASRSFDIFGRSSYRPTDHPYAQMQWCAAAVDNDDILGDLADVVESLAFSKMRFKHTDADQQDIWNQIAGIVNLDARVREMFRELYKVSQFTAGIWWRRMPLKVRDRVAIEDFEDSPRPGNRRRRKTFDLVVPAALTVFDHQKVVPVGNLMFGGERLAYVADTTEDVAFGRVFDAEAVDDQVLRMIQGRYTPGESERRELADMDVPVDRLWLLRADSVFRHTLTKASYERFAPVRLKSVLPILDLKQHLRASDRATLIGNTNFIVVIRKGTDKLPAKPAEIEMLQEQARVVARMPILVGDHRLSVDIVTPALDNTLTESRWHVLDARLVNVALGTYAPSRIGASASGGTQVSELSRVVAQGIQNRRHMLVRTLEASLFARTLERNQGALEGAPKLEFNPRRVTLDFSADVLNAVLKVRDRGDISRETMLEEFDYDQDTEMARRLRERADYDPAFESSVPFSSPGTNPFTVGATGGRPSGATDSEPRQRSGRGGDSPTSTG